LPAFPDTIIKLQKVLDNPDTNISDIAKLIEMYPILSGNILRVANSCPSLLSGLMHDIGIDVEKMMEDVQVSVNQAMELLG